jgi:hypothetical protein
MQATYPLSKPPTMKTIMSGSTCCLGKGLSVAGSWEHQSRVIKLMLALIVR